MVVAVNGAELFFTTRGTGYPCIVPCVLGVKPYELLTPPPLTDYFRFIYVDLRGGGQSTGDPSELTFDELADDLDAVRAHLGIGRVTVLGYSILGIVALEYGRRCRETVSHVIVAGTPPTGDLQEMSAASKEFFDQDGSEERKRILQENLAKLPPDAPPTEAVFAQTPLRFFDPQFDATPIFAESEFKPKLFARVLGPLTSGWKVTDEPETLAVPTLIAHGRYDYIVPCTMWHGIVQRLPAATLHVFARSGHQPFFEEPARFADVVRAWMARCAAPQQRLVRRS